MALAHDYTDVQDLPAPPKTDDTAAGLFRLSVSMTFAKDEEIYGQDEDAYLVYRVLDGAVRTTRVMADGRRQIGDFYLAGDIFGLEAGPTHRFAAEAVRDSVILVIKASTLRSSGGDLGRLGWEATRRELERAQEHVIMLGRKTACAMTFCRACPRCGWPPNVVHNRHMEGGRSDSANPPPCASAAGP